MSDSAEPEDGGRSLSDMKPCLISAIGGAYRLLKSQTSGAARWDTNRRIGILEVCSDPISRKELLEMTAGLRFEDSG
jgi:hypothetical protein